VAQRGYGPTLHDIGAHFGLSSPATVHKHVKRLVERGALRKSAHRARSVEPDDAAPAACRLRLLGVVAAGVPIEVSEVPEEIAVPLDLVRRPDETFALRVRGDSMIEDGILSGDLVIVEARKEAADGDTVVALVRGSEVTLKKLRRRGGMVELLPANARLEPIVLPADEVEIQGVVRGLVRRFAHSEAS